MRRRRRSKGFSGSEEYHRSAATEMLADAKMDLSAAAKLLRKSGPLTKRACVLVHTDLRSAAMPLWGAHAHLDDHRNPALDAKARKLADDWHEANDKFSSKCLGGRPSANDTELVRRSHRHPHEEP